MSPSCSSRKGTITRKTPASEVLPDAEAKSRRNRSRRSVALDAFITELKASNATDRLERFLRLLASASGSTSEAGVLRVMVPLRDEQLGDMLGCSPRHFKRIRKQLQQAGRLRVDRDRTFILTTQ